jgi:uncharacterized integral membrane protein
VRDAAGEPQDGPRPGEADAGHEGAPLTQQIGRVAVVLVAVVFVIFALANAQHVDFSWVLGQTEVVRQGGERISGGVPLIVLLLLAFTAGALVAGLLAWQRGRHRRHDPDER